MTLQLRDYQADLAMRAFRALANDGSAVIQLETGAGKTHIAAEMCRVWARAKKRIWFVAHRQEILDQARRIFDEAAISHGAGTLVEFRMIAAAVRGAKAKLGPDVLIFDECHHAPAESWATVVGACPKALRLGLTATPGRLDRKPLADYFTTIIQGPPARELRAKGYLAGYRYFAPVLPDLTQVKVRESEYDRGEITELMTGPSIVGDVVEHYRRHADGKRAVLFAVSIEASADMAARFNAAGIPALHIDAKTPDDERAAAIDSVRRGAVQVLCNVELFTEGFDLPAIDAVILLRPTRSLAFFRQMLGRGARPSSRDGKTVILDHAALVRDHGLPDEEYEWTLDGERPRRKIEIEGGERIRPRRCPECDAVHPWASVCEECGHEYAAGSREATELGGNLREMTRAPLGCVTLAQYGRMRGVSGCTPYSWVKKGMPTESGFVRPSRADEWRVKYRERIRAANSAQAKAFMSQAAVRAAVSNRMKAINSNVEVRAKASNRVKAWMSDPLNKQKRDNIARRLKESVASPEGRSAISVRMKEKMSSAEARTALSLKVKESLSSPEIRSLISDRVKQAARRPEVKSALSASAKARSSEPGAKAAFVARISSPCAREKRSAARRLSRANRDGVRIPPAGSETHDR